MGDVLVDAPGERPHDFEIQRSRARVVRQRVAHAPHAPKGAQVILPRRSEGVAELAVVGHAHKIVPFIGYTVLLWALTILFWPVAEMGWVYGVSAIVLGAAFLWFAVELYRTESTRSAMKLFGWSITYVTLLFGAMAVVLAADALVLLKSQPPPAEAVAELAATATPDVGRAAEGGRVRCHGRLALRHDQRTDQEPPRQ